MSNDLISRTALLDAMQKEFDDDYMFYPAEYRAMVEQMPAAQSERKRGKWLPDIKFGTDVMAGNTICSVCGMGAWDQPNYCPHCGADMQEAD